MAEERNHHININVEGGDILGTYLYPIPDENVAVHVSTHLLTISGQWPSNTDHN